MSLVTIPSQAATGAFGRHQMWQLSLIETNQLTGDAFGSLAHRCCRWLWCRLALDGCWWLLVVVGLMAVDGCWSLLMAVDGCGCCRWWLLMTLSVAYISCLDWEQWRWRLLLMIDVDGCCWCWWLWLLISLLFISWCTKVTIRDTLSKLNAVQCNGVVMNVILIFRMNSFVTTQ